MKIVTKQFIDKALTNTYWNVGNNVLYKLCVDNFEHKEVNKILAKVWLIGRAYSVALERIKKKMVNNDSYYIDTIAPAFLNSRIDTYLNDLSNIKEIDSNNIQQVLECHYYITKMIYDFTNDNKRSFASKYLHFHLPNLFFIYDSRANTSLSKLSCKVSDSSKYLLKLDNVEKEYAMFFCKCFALKKEIESTYETKLSTREIDNILMEIANNKPI